MGILLLCTVALAADSQPIMNTRNLTDHEWSRVCLWSEEVTGRVRTETHGGRAHEMISLRADTEWSSGTAWFISYRVGGPQSGDSYVTAAAYKGYYRIFSREGEKDVLLIKLGFTKKYRGLQSGGDGSKELEWSLQTRFQGEGADVVLSLETGSRIPESEIELSVERAYYVGQDGKETIRRDEPYTLMERISGRGEVLELHRLSFVALGSTLRLKKGDIFRSELGDVNMPPTFRPRADGVESHTVLRPSLTDGQADSERGSTNAELLAKGHRAFKAGEYRRAIALYSAVLELYPTSSDAFKWRGCSHCRLGDYVAGGKDLTRAITIRPQDPFCYWERGNAYVKLGYWQRGVVDYKEYVRLRPDDASGRNAISWILATCPDQNVRDGSEAVVHGEKACKLTNFKDPIYIDTLAAAYAEIGDFDRAVRLQTVATELVPENEKNAYLDRLRLFERRKPYREHPSK